MSRLALKNEDYPDASKKHRGDEIVEKHPVGILLARIQAELRPDLIVVDCRAGLSPISGFILSPLADVHVVFSTASDQALDGLRRIVHRLGADRLQAGLPQGECVLVQAMLPGSSSGGEAARSFFDARVEDIFSFHYYERPTVDTVTPSSDDATWLLDDLELPDAPHRAIAIPYRERLADFHDLKDILDIFEESPYRALATRINARLSSRGAAKPDPEDV